MADLCKSMRVLCGLCLRVEQEQLWIVDAREAQQCLFHQKFGRRQVQSQSDFFAFMAAMQQVLGSMAFAGS